MTQPANRKAHWDPKAKEQSDRIKQALTDLGTPVWTEEAADGGVSFMCHDRQILVRESHLELVQRILGQETSRRNVTPVIADVVLLALDTANFLSSDLRVPLGARPTVKKAVEAVDQVLGLGVATPDHVLTVCQSGPDGVVSPCPATEPEVPEQHEPVPYCADNKGQGVRIYIADTGLLQDASTHSWLEGVRRATKPDGSPQAWDPAVTTDPSGVQRIPLYSGHGTFVAGVVRCLAPATDVIVSNVFKDAGSALESDFVRDLVGALRLGIDIFNLTVTAPSRLDLPLMAFARWLRLLDQYGKAVCIAPAGNSGVPWPSWPAAFPLPQMVSVGALTADEDGRAGFSNFGSWVDVYARGEDVVNAYATGTYIYYYPPEAGSTAQFSGMAMWSGTSFSTPIVTGLIADRMSQTGENGQQAAAQLLRKAQAQAIYGVGAVLHPCDG